MDDVRAESLFRKNPVEYRRLIDEGRRTGHKYIKEGLGLVNQSSLVFIVVHPILTIHDVATND